MKSLSLSVVAEQTFLRMVGHSFHVLKESLPFGGRPRRAEPLVGTHTTRSLVWFAQDAQMFWISDLNRKLGELGKKGCDFQRQVFKR